MILFMDRQRAARAVAARRGELGMTQHELADAAGVDPKTIGNLERRGKWPIARNRALIEKALGWPVGQLERLASEEEPEEPRIPQEILESINRVWAGEENAWVRQRLIDGLRQALEGTSAAPPAAERGRHRRVG